MTFCKITFNLTLTKTSLTKLICFGWEVQTYVGSCPNLAGARAKMEDYCWTKTDVD